jgi:FkbM family methyltransferase
VCWCILRASNDDPLLLRRARQIDGRPTWEPSTFESFNKFLPRARYYVGFGTWIGPTLFHAAQQVTRAIGLEADPVAFATVEENLGLNANESWFEDTSVYPVGIGEGVGTQVTRSKMSSSSAGNSCSGLTGSGNGCGPSVVEWEVPLYTLPHIMQLSGIPASSDTFIKIDVEG